MKQITRFNPLASATVPSGARTDFYNSFNTLVDDFFNSNFLSVSPVQTEFSYPKLNAYRSVDRGLGKSAVNTVVVDIFVPYLQKEDVEIEANEADNTLTVSAKSHQDENIADTDYYIRQVPRGSFKRAFIFTKDYPVSKAVADLKDGILRITVPSVIPEKAETKKIKIG